MHDVQSARHCMVRNPGPARRHHRLQRNDEAAQVQRKALGMDDARYLLVDHPIQDATDDEMRQKARDVLEDVVRALRD